MSISYFTIVPLFISFCSIGQTKNHRVVVDKKKNYFYSDTAGITQSYISYFGDSFSIPALKTIDGKIITQADLKGKTILYNFWFVSCKPCVAEIPALNNLAQKYQSDSTLFIAITFDKEARIKDFLQKHTFNFQIASLPQEKINAIKKISFYPFTVIVTKREKIFFGLFSRPLGKNPEVEIFHLLDIQMEKAITQ